MDGAPVLEEHSDAELACTLWGRLEDALLWASTPTTNRAGLFGEHGQFPKLAELVPPRLTEDASLSALTTLALLAITPEEANERQVAEACLRIADWAGVYGHAATELSYAEASATIDPDNPFAALDAGRVARQQAMYERAGQWFQRAIDLARTTNDWHAYTLAFIRWATSEHQRGRLLEARRLLLRAWKAAKRYKLRELGAFAQHDLLVLSYEIGTFEEGMAHAATAYRLYGRKTERLPHLAHDAAFLWMHHGYFSAALPVFIAALPFVARATERVQVLANIGRAAAAIGDYERFYSAWDAVTTYGASSEDYLAASLVNIAQGALTLGLRRQAQDVATIALQIAQRRGEPAPEALALRLLEIVNTSASPERNRPAPRATLEMQQAFLLRLAKMSNQP